MNKLQFEPEHQESMDIQKLRELVWNVVTTEIEETTKEIEFWDYKIIDLGDEEYGVKVLSHLQTDTITPAEIEEIIANHSEELLNSFIFTQAHCDRSLLIAAAKQGVLIITFDSLQQFLSETDSEYQTFEELSDFAFRNYWKVRDEENAKQNNQEDLPGQEQQKQPSPRKLPRKELIFIIILITLIMYVITT